MEKELSIGVFDSGVGGLTVVRELLRVLPTEHLVYLGDTARLPYGSKSGDTVLRYSRNAARFLLQQGVKLIVIACNTASAYALPALAEELSVPVIGVIEPGAEEAVRASRDGQIGVIATEGTVSSGAYTRAIKRILPDAVVMAKACPLFVPLVEEGWVEGEVPRLVAKRYLTSFQQMRPTLDTLVLGCTHYPLLEEVIEQEVEAALGVAVTVVSSARATALAVRRLMQERGLCRIAETEGERQFYVTDSSPRFAEIGARFLGAPISLAWVDLSTG